MGTDGKTEEIIGCLALLGGEREGE